MKNENIIDADFGIIERSLPTPPKKWKRIHINKKTLMMAILLEVAIIGCCACAGWLFAAKYGDGTNLTWFALINGAAILTVAELARIGLTCNAATHRRASVRVLSIVAVIFACGVTTETLVLVADMRYGPRLAAVNEARTELNRVKSQLSVPESINADAKAQIGALNEEIKNLDATLKMFGKPPAFIPSTYDRNGKVLRKGFQPPWQGKDTQEKRNNAIAQRDAILGRLSNNGQEIASKAEEVIVARGIYDKAVLHSTMHSLAGMAFGKSPGEVTDGELYTFLRFFVFVISFFIAAVSSVLNYGAFTRYEPQDEPEAKKSRRQTVEIIPALRGLAIDLKLKKEAA